MVVTGSTATAIAALILELELAAPGTGIVIRRLYPGWAQRSRGAWSWSAMTPKFVTICGSQWSMTKVLRAHKKGVLSILRKGARWDLNTELVVENDDE